MDDWEETALASRHVHNRVGRGSAVNKGKGPGAFDPRRMIGTYELKCPSLGNNESSTANHKTKSRSSKSLSSRLDIRGFSDDGEGLVGAILLSGAVEAAVALAGSRKVLQNIQEASDVTAKKDELEDPESGVEEEMSGDGDDDDDDNDGDQDENLSHPDELERERCQKFAKNSFRAPKFWLRWHGAVHEGADIREAQTGMGYLVFTGNDCRKFQGTISCELLGWNNVRITGWKYK
ncbi:catalase [Xylariomycetidae sp. FL2044]|nr:catalase [Xylariomycetidae sp. FL2044]